MASNNSGDSAPPFLPRQRSRQNTPTPPPPVAESSTTSSSVDSDGQDQQISLSGDVTNTGHDDHEDGHAVVHEHAPGNDNVCVPSCSSNGQHQDRKWLMTPSMMQAYLAMRGPRNDDHDDDSELDPLALFEKRRKGEFKMNSYRSDPLIGHIERQEEQRMFMKPSTSAAGNSMIADICHSATGERPQKDDPNRKSMFYYDRPETFKHLEGVEFTYPELEAHDGYGYHSAWSAKYQNKKGAAEEKEDHTITDFDNTSADLNDDDHQALVLRNPTPVNMADADQEASGPSSLTIRNSITVMEMHDNHGHDIPNAGPVTLYLSPSSIAGDADNMNTPNEDVFSAIPSPISAEDAVWEYKANIDADSDEQPAGTGSDEATDTWGGNTSNLWGGSTAVDYLPHLPGSSSSATGNINMPNMNLGGANISMPELSATSKLILSFKGTPSLADFERMYDSLESDDGEGDHETGRISPCSFAFLAKGARHHTFGGMPKPTVPEDIGSQRPTVPEDPTIVAEREKKRLERLNNPKAMQMPMQGDDGDNDSSMYGTCSFYSVTTNPSFAWTARGVDPEETKKYVDTTFDRMNPAAAQLALVQGGVEIRDEAVGPSSAVEEGEGDEEFFSKEEVAAAIADPSFAGVLEPGINAANLDRYLLVTRDAIAISQQKEKAMDHTIKFLERRIDELNERKQEAYLKAMILARKRAKDAGTEYVPTPFSFRAGGVVPLPPPGYAPPTSPAAVEAKAARIRAQIARQVRELRHVLGVRARALDRKRETHDELVECATDLEREIGIVCAGAVGVGDFDVLVEALGQSGLTEEELAEFALA
ncbi:hypothetical protein B0T19DRAFT_403930 [Cercophora scortea]|uniref:Uncharacterized protein n=1 Tax=Cercophora scortea TaxID=314031 RepID=A0AAE0IAA7_9PEZI|nr:hypothetical protein B0T19DRAFT_403930 [Cercophora scortea]